MTAPTTTDTHYDPAGHELRVRVRGQSGRLGTLTTIVDQPDGFLLDAARLYSQHIGTRLEQLRVIDALTDAATHDALTGLGNRRAAQASIDTLQPGDAVFILDLDHFKTINDSLGHQAGDQVLTQLGDYLRAFTRPTDSVARYGGEEFLLISPATTRDAPTTSRTGSSTAGEHNARSSPSASATPPTPNDDPARTHHRTRRHGALRSQTRRPRPRPPVHSRRSNRPACPNLVLSERVTTRGAGYTGSGS